MKFFGKTIGKSRNDVIAGEVKKALKDWDKTRPDADDAYRTTQKEDAVRIPLYPISEDNMYAISLMSDMIQTITQTRQNTIFRRGFEIRKDDEESTDDTTEEIKGILENINQNGQTGRDLGRQIEQDLIAINNAYVICRKKYYYKTNGEIAEDLTEVQEFIRGNPLKMKIIADREGNLGYNEDGQKMYFDPTDRTRIYKESEAENLGFKGPSGKVMIEACYRGELKAKKMLYYSRDEVLHVTYDSAILYGNPKLLSCWMKVMTLIEQDRYLLLAYQKQRPPRGFLAMSTTNLPSLKAAWETLKALVRKDPHSINPMMIESKDGKPSLQFIDLMKSLPEMQFTESRNEMRRGIGALYGVMPMFSGDIQTAGGLNNESQQLTITDDAAIEAQKLYNQKMLPWILKQYEDKYENYSIVIKEPREKDENVELDKLNKKTDHALKMQQMGFDVKFNEDEETFEFSDEPVKQEAAPLVELPGMEDEEEVTKGYKEKLHTILNVTRDDLKSEGIKFNINKQGAEDFVAFVALSMFDKVYSGVSKTASRKVNDIILVSIAQKTPIDNVIKQIEDLGIPTSQAELIVRTEQSVLQNKAREFNYKQATGAEAFKYKWLIANDDRTAEVSKEIARKSAKGIPLEDLKKLVRETAKAHGFKPDRDWNSHPNQRSTFARAF